MATISEIRRSNLLRLCASAKIEFEKEEKNKNTRFTDIIFCQQVGISTSTFSQLKNITQKPYINEVYVRNIEKHINLELGWFDIDRDSTNLEALRLNFEQFRKGVLAYHDFIHSGIISINNDEKREHLMKNFFLFIYSQADINKTEITEADFFEFMK
ncbi:MAG: hypothetical protein JKY19_11205 [Alcanivoracaceae bacterium]|nr:hypothetical protein [Alcanivoracaceae bacterium]